MNKNVYSISLSLLLSCIYIFYNNAYSQICPPDAGTELIVNGDFEAGNTGFGSDYTYSSPTVGPGNYTVGTSPNTSNSYFANIQDHTPGAGKNNMLIIDVDGTVGKNAYNTTVNVLPNTTYFFSAWFSNINTNTSCATCGGIYFENSPMIRFSINNAVVGDIVRVDSSSHAWNQFFVTWNSGAVSGNITIRIENIRTGSGGNDLALDDISFSTSCKYIQNLASLGKTSILPDTIYACNEALPIVLNPQLGASKYTFQWKNSSGTLLAAPNTGPTYSFTSAPAEGKYYLCYDSIADNIGCPRTDSIIVLNELKVNIAPDQLLCDPINYTINSHINAPGITFNWERNNTPLSTNTAAHQAIADGTYKLSVTKPGCPPASGSMKITKIIPTMAGTGVYCSTSTPKEATFSVTGANKIGGSINVEWYNVATGGSKLTTTIKDDSTINVKSPNYVTIPGVCEYGLYAEDKNSFNTTASQGAMGTISASNNTFRTMIVVKGNNLALNSLDFYQMNYSTGGTATYVVNIYSNKIASSCGKVNANTADVIAYPNVGSITLPKTTTATLRTIPLNVSLPGSTAGEVYWIEITGAEFGVSGNAKPYGTVNNNSPGQNVLSIGDVADGACYPEKKGNIANINATSGKTNSCGRVFVCATTESCTLPVEFLSIEAKSNASGTIITWATTWELNNKLFIVQKSLDGKTFYNIGQVEGSGNTNTINRYSFTDAAKDNTSSYYRIIQVDFNGASETSKIVSSNVYNSDNQVLVFPVPSKKGEPITFNFSEKSAKTLRISDLYGKVLFLEQIDPEEENYSLNFNLLSGIYIAEIENEFNLKVLKKLIIE